MADATPTTVAVEAALVTPEAPATEAPTDPPADLGDAGKKALDAERRARKAAEKEREQFAARLKELEDRDKSEAEKAIEAARREADQSARTEMTREFGRRVAAAEIKAALTGVVADPEAIVEDLNLDRFLTDDGEVDPDAVTRLRDKHAANAQPGRPRGDADQGPRGAATTALNGDPLRESIENILNAR